MSHRIKNVATLIFCPIDGTTFIRVLVLEKKVSRYGLVKLSNQSVHKSTGSSKAFEMGGMEPYRPPKEVSMHVRYLNILSLFCPLRILKKCYVRSLRFKSY